MSDITEIIISGYCKAHNASRLICCEYTTDQGFYNFQDVDCDYPDCKYSSECTVIKEALAKEEEDL